MMLMMLMTMKKDDTGDGNGDDDGIEAVELHKCRHIHSLNHCFILSFIYFID